MHCVFKEIYQETSNYHCKLNNVLKDENNQSVIWVDLFLVLFLKTVILKKMTIPLHCKLTNSPSVMYSEVFNEYSYNSFSPLTGLKTMRMQLIPI